MRRTLTWITGALLLAGAAGARAEDAGARLRQGKEAFEGKCRLCHSIQTPLAAVKTREEWTQTVKKMVLYGAPANARDREAIVGYLAARSDFARRCNACHDATRAVDAAEGAKDWKALVERMSAHLRELEQKGKSPGPLSPQEVEEIAALLALLLPQ